MFHVPSFIDAHRNGPFHSAVHLMYQPKFPEFGVELKAPYMSSILDDIKCFSAEYNCQQSGRWI